MIKDIVAFNRSYRRFYTEERIKRDELVHFIELARLSPSPRNLQPYKFIISTDIELNKRIYETLAWAGYLTNWSGPDENERPTAYIIISNDKTISKNLDRDNLCYGCGIVAQSILLGAAEKKYGGCIIASVQRSKLAEEINLSDQYEIMLVLALGAPKEEIILDDLNETRDIRYWRDEDRVHHVPKRKIDELIMEIEKKEKNIPDSNEVA